MSEIIDGVEGEWERRESFTVEDGERYRVTGVWHGYGESLDLSDAYDSGKAVFDVDEDIVEVFVPTVDEDALPTEDGIYGDADGDLWRLYAGQWTFLSDNSGMDNPEYYTPLHKVAGMFNNFER